MAKSLTKLERILDRLEKLHGPPAPLRITDPLEIILFDTVVYLADDQKRAIAFAALKKRVGLKPQKIQAAPQAVLVEIGGMGGILPKISARKLREVAAIALEKFDGRLQDALKLPPKQARKALKQFPGVGDPGAEKILLFTGTEPVFAMDSNVLRVVCRLGFSEETKNYSASYRAAQQSLQGQIPANGDALVRAYQLLRRHGMEICRRTNPLCESCPLQRECDYFHTSFRGNSSGGQI
jgi:endonuclease-3